jgi:hypothetical protein
MRDMRMFWLAGPLVVRDLVVGSSGIGVAVFAFVAGCALASSGTLVWFGYVGLLGVVSLATCLPQLRRINRTLRGPARNDDDIQALPFAA